MSSVSERLREHLEREKVARKKREIVQREEEKKEREKLELALSLNKEAIRLIQPEKILSEININLLHSRGKIVKKEGLLIHNHFSTSVDAERYTYYHPYPYTHAIASVSLLWKIKDHCHRLMIAVGGDSAEFRDGGVYWSEAKKEYGYPDVLDCWCEEKRGQASAAAVYVPSTVSLPIKTQNLDDSERLKTVRKQIDESIETLYFRLKKVLYLKTEDILP